MLALALTLQLTYALVAQDTIFLSEILYHPVEEPTFDTQGKPTLDLSEDVHEFVELHNAGAETVDLGGWSLSGGISFDFPPGFTLARGAFVVVARDPVRLAAVSQYALRTNEIAGPYTGRLGNRGDTVRLKNKAGKLVDGVSYSAGFPWAIGADGLGAGDDWTGLKSVSYQYRGRSLERVSYSWPSNDPANWIASPLPSGPTPGRTNSFGRTTPAPVVVAFSFAQSSNGATRIGSNEPVRLDVTFSASDSLSEVSVEYFVDDIELQNEPRFLVPLSLAAIPGDTHFTGTLPGQPNRSIVRFRIRANRGDAVETVSPRADDPFAWHAYFVTPARTSANPIYDVFISAASLNRLGTNISQSPRRVTLPDPPGTPRASWNATEPAVLVANSQVYDIRMRHHGSRYNRSVARNSFKFLFPRYARLNGRSSFFETDKGEEHRLGSKLYDAANLPVWRCRYVNVYLNKRAVLTRLEQEEMDDDLYERWSEEQAALFPETPRPDIGDFFKSEGVVPYETGSGMGTASYERSGEGPYYIGNAAPIPAKAGWTLPARYDWTYPNQTHAWKGGSEAHEMITALWAARGDSPAAPRPNLAALRAFLLENFDVDSTLTYLAIRNWSAPIDNATHNHFLWRQADGRWAMMPWDLDGEFGASTRSIYWDEQTNPQPDTLRGPHWVKDSFFKAFRSEYRQKLFLLSHTLLAPANLSAIGAGGLASFAAARQSSVDSQVALGTWYAPLRPTNRSPIDGSAAFPGVMLATDAYLHSDPRRPLHASTTWLIRSAVGAYSAPIVRETSSANLTSRPIPFERLTFGNTYYWKCLFTDADGHPSSSSAETSFVFGPTGNVKAGDLILNEVLAENHGSVAYGGRFPDYVELANITGERLDLTAFSLSDNVLSPGKYFFPPGTTVEPHGFLTVWCDDSTNAPGLHSGFALDKDGQTIALFAVTPSGYSLADSLVIGLQIPDFSIGRLGDNWTLNIPTPGAPNAFAATGPAATLKINEWMASSNSGSDWFELFNPAPLPVALGGLYLSNSNLEPTNSRIAPLTFIGPEGYRQFLADKKLEKGPRHVNFKLGISGDTLLVSTADQSRIDSVTFGQQETDVSQGRLLDGTENVTSFPGSDSPEAPNFRPLTNIVINEVLADSDSTREGAIELFNTSVAPANIGGWWISDSLHNLKKFRIAPNFPVLEPGHFALFLEREFNNPASSAAFSLDSKRVNEVYLSAATLAGDLTGQRTGIQFGPVSPGVSVGRVPTSVGVDLWAQSARTLGAANSGPLVGPVVVSEIQFQPPPLPDDEGNFEYVRLQNVTDTEVPLFDPIVPGNSWRLRDAVEFAFPTNVILPPRASLVVVGFDPLTEKDLTRDFRGLYGLDENVVILGPYTGKLDNNGDTLELVKPYGAPDSDLANPGFVRVDRVKYETSPPWPAGANGTGLSLHRAIPASFGGEPTNWIAGPSVVDNLRPAVAITQPPSGAAFGPHQTITITAAASDADGTVQRLELFADNLKIAAAPGALLSITWTNAAVGTHKLVARAVDNQLGVADSTPVFVDVINRPPNVAILAPTNGASFDLPANITIEATATDPDGGVAQVDFYATGVLLGSVLAPPYRFVWTNVPSGSHQLVAVAKDEFGVIVESQPISLHAARELTLAYVVNPGTVGGQDFGSGLGMDFNVLTKIVVTRLGVFDSGADGIQGDATLTAQLYSRAGDSGSVKASLAFNAASPGVLIGGSRLKPLPLPLLLAPGSYSIVSYGYNAANPNGNSSGGESNDWFTDGSGGLIEFVGVSRYGGSPGNFPATIDGGPADRYAAGTFEFARAVAPPAALKAAGGDSRVFLAWDSSPGATRYIIKRAKGADSPYLSIGTSTLRQYLDPNVVNGETYYYVVAAANAASESGDSVAVRATPHAAPSLGAIVLGTGGSLILSWPIEPTGYTLFRATNLSAPIHWESVANAPEDRNGIFQVTLPVTNTGEQFFRLSPTD